MDNHPGAISTNLIQLPSDPGHLTLITGARLIDGQGGEPRDGVSILVAGAIIKEIGADGTVALGKEPHRRIEAAGKTVIPGLIDAHVHLTGQATFDPYRRYLWPSDGVKTIKAVADAERALEAGWTTVVDLGWPSPALDIRAAAHLGIVVAPRILSAVAALSPTGGHGDWHALPYQWVKEREFRGRLVDGEDECRKAVRLNFREGADLTKIMVTSAGFGSERDWPPRDIFGEEELAAIVDETKKHLGTIAAHCIGGSGVRKAIAAGVNTVEHGVVDPEDYDILGTMAAQGVTLIPTLSIFYWFAEEGLGRGMSAWGVDMAKRVMATQMAMVRRAKEAGVPIATGTDTGSSYGIGQNAKELELLVQAGLTPMEAIVAATRNAARARGIGAEVGTLEPSKQAEMLLLNVDPLGDVRALQSLESIEAIIRPDPAAVPANAARART